MERWLDDAQPEGSDDTSGPEGTLFAGRRTGIQARAVRAGSFWEAAKEPGSARTEAAAPLPAGTAVYPAFTDVGAAEPLHDADELTVRLGGIDPVSAAGASGNRLDSQEGAGTPVFVDESGRRSRRLRLLGVAVGVVCAVYALVIVGTLVSGNSSAPWLPLPGLGDDTPVGQVETSSVPSASASPSGSDSAAPKTGSSDSAASVSSTGDGVTDAPGATASAGRPAASALPEASTGTKPVNPVATATASSPAVSDSAVASPEASQPDGGASASPSAVDDTGLTGEILGEANSASVG
ncbi:hypothetical protein ACIRPU_34600 [Streptomyces sp. NPDC102259]|uniref:hypothetical protein n=1 Tax=Streptomyces sp. NPDC102259 TaxID=3366148 RepID=UPI0037F7CEC7